MESPLDYFLQLSQMWKAVVIGLFAMLFTLWWTKPVPHLPRGPIGIPFIGSILDLRDDTIETMEDWAKYFGPYMTIYIGRVRTIVLNTREAVEEALIKQPAEFVGRPQSYSGGQLTGGYKGLIHSNYTPTLQHQRRITSMAFRSYSFLPAFHLETKVNTSVQRLVELLLTEKTPVDPAHYMSIITGNVLSGICFNTTHDLDDPELRWFLKRLKDFSANSRGFFWEDYLPLLRACPTARFRRVVRILRELKEHVCQKLEEHKDTFDPENVRDVTDVILLSVLEDEEAEVGISQRLTDGQVVHTLLDIFIGGHDPTRHTLTWTILYLASHPDVQDNVHEELDAVLESRKFASLADRTDLNYLQAVINESMRLSSVIPLGVTHTAVSDATLGHYDAPKGTDIIVNHWMLNHDPANWEEPDKFKPERFLGEDGKVKVKVNQFIPFSVGRRSCLGEHVVRPQLLLIVAGILKNFRISVPEDVTADLKPVYKTPFNIPTEVKVVFNVR